MHRHLVIILSKEWGLCVASHMTKTVRMFTVACHHYFFLRKAIELPIPMLGKNVHPVTVATFSDLSPGTHAHYHISRIIMIELNYRD